MTRRKIVFASDFKLSGSGYHSIASGLATTLSKYADVTVLGCRYIGEQHEYPFHLIPTTNEWVPQHILAMKKALDPDLFVLMFDVPRLIAIKDNVIKQMTSLNILDWKLRIAAAFPVEADPLWLDWAVQLAKFNALFTFTDLGMGEVSRNKLPVNLLQVSPLPIWDDNPGPIPSGPLAGKKYVLAIADNQHRKNIPCMLRAIQSAVNAGTDIKLVLITDLYGTESWDLRPGSSVYKRLGVDENNVIILSNLGQSEIVRLMYNATCYLNTSFAEGIGIPVFEAVTAGCPVIVPDGLGCTGALKGVDPSMYRIIPSSVTMIYPWGQCNWREVDHVAVADAITHFAKVRDTLTFRYRYPNWEDAAQKILACAEVSIEATKEVVPDEQKQE